MSLDVSDDEKDREPHRKMQLQIDEDDEDECLDSLEIKNSGSTDENKVEE